MRFTLRNLGRLQEATIDLDKDLILLTGPNNTSKTYVAHAIYGFCWRLQSLLQRIVERALRSSASVDEATEARMKVNMLDFVEHQLTGLLQEVAQSFCKELSSVFASSEEFVARAEVAIDVSEKRLTASKQSLHQLSTDDRLIRDKERSYALRKVADDNIFTIERLAGIDAAGTVWMQQELLEISSAWIAFELKNQFLGAPHDSYILTAERAAIQLFSRELSRRRTELVDDLLRLKDAARRQHDTGGDVVGEALEQRARRYPLAILHSVLLANDLIARTESVSNFVSLANQLDGNILGGMVRVQEDGDVVFQPMSSDASLNLHLSSSSVKSLAGLSFFLRYRAKKGQLLIIDEPELNLHPDNQRRVARVLARLARAGVKVLISTHSDYIIREINNLIMLSADRDGALRQRHGYEEEETLSPAQVGAYLFDATHARPLEVQPTGIEVETIDREINALNTVSQDIYFSLFGKAGRAPEGAQRAPAAGLPDLQRTAPAW